MYLRSSLTEPLATAAGSAGAIRTETGSGCRVGYLVSRYPAVSHTFILREVQALRARGMNIEVASINRPDRSREAMTADERAEADRCYYVKAHGVHGAVAAHLRGLRQPRAYLRGLRAALRLGGRAPRELAYALFYFTEALMLARWMKAHRLSHLHVHFATAAAKVGLLLRESHGIGFSMTVHGPDEFYDVSAEWLQAKLCAADFVVCISRYARSQVMKLTPMDHWHKFEVCPLGVDPDAYEPTAGPADDQPFTILCVGRLTPAKGQGVLAQACARLAAAGRDFRLVYVGAGPDEDALRRAVDQLGLGARTVFTGALNQEEVAAWYRRAHAFALPSFAEGKPVVLMEAMASALPCVTTHITGIPELIRHDREGLLVTPSDHEELADALARLMDSPDLRARLGKAGRARVEDAYDLHRNGQRLASLLARRVETAA